MIGFQFKLTGPSANGTSTDLGAALAANDRKKRVCLLRPILDVVQLRTRNGVNAQGTLGEVLEDEDHIKPLETELNALQGSDLNFRQGDDEERRVREVHQALSSRLQADVLSNGYTFEGQFTGRNINFQCIARLRIVRTR